MKEQKVYFFYQSTLSVYNVNFNSTVNTSKIAENNFWFVSE